MVVNGTEIKVGQIWQTYGGNVVKVVAADDYSYFTFCVAVDGTEYRVGRNGRKYGDIDYTDAHANDADLKRLIADKAADYTLWPGVGNPVPGVRVAVITRGGGRETADSEGFAWGHNDCPSDIIAYKVVQEAAKPTAVLDRPTSALDVQEGGNHYKSLVIQPVEYIHKNNLDYFQGNVIKYITRHKSKNGAEDVRKALHYCQLVLELQYGEKTK